MRWSASKHGFTDYCLTRITLHKLLTKQISRAIYALDEVAEKRSRQTTLVLFSCESLIACTTSQISFTVRYHKMDASTRISVVSCLVFELFISTKISIISSKAHISIILYTFQHEKAFFLISVATFFVLVRLYLRTKKNCCSEV